jgi:hypothetical protein
MAHNTTHRTFREVLAALHRGCRSPAYEKPRICRHLRVISSCNTGNAGGLVFANVFQKSGFSWPARRFKPWNMQNIVFDLVGYMPQLKLDIKN